MEKLYPFQGCYGEKTFFLANKNLKIQNWKWNKNLFCEKCMNFTKLLYKEFSW
jgi:hypothetical protein